MQDCTDSNNLKLTFPDIDYSFQGYDILKGFPLAMGRDPGFTYPIFKADYSKKTHSGDCRYSVPRGLVVIPDVSCDVSFSSSVVKTTREYESELSVSAHVSGGGWGVQFSASAGYQQTKSEISKGEFTYVISTAKCNYYTSKIQDSPLTRPLFDDTFLTWVKKLEQTTDEQDYLAFYMKYGTHYPTEVTYGARFTQESRIQTSEVEKMESSGVNVGVEASYSGLFSVGGGMNMDSSQRQKASDFASKSEKRTITVGSAPPSDGDAMTWASNVQQNPVPTMYALDDIANLFTDRFMDNLNLNYNKIRKTLERTKVLHWQSVQRHSGATALVSSLKNSIMIPNWYVDSTYEETDISYSDCYRICKNLVECYGVSFCPDCARNQKSHCYVFESNVSSTDWKFNDKWQTVFVAGGSVYLRGIVVSDLSDQPMATVVANIRGTSGSMKLGDAQQQCKAKFKTYQASTRGDKAMAYSFGFIFKQYFAICKIYNSRKTLMLKSRQGFVTLIDTRETAIQ